MTKKKLGLIATLGFLAFGVASCWNTDKTPEIEVTPSFDNSEVFGEDTDVSNNDSDINVSVNTDETYGETLVLTADTGSTYLGESAVQVSAEDSTKANLRYVFAIKSLSCDIKLTRTLREHDTNQTQMTSKVYDIDTVYSSYYNGSEYVAAQDNVWYVIYTMTDIPYNYWDSMLDVSITLYEEDTTTELASNESITSTLITVYNDNSHSGLLSGDFGWSKIDSSTCKLTSYSGSSANVIVPGKIPGYEETGNKITDAYFFDVASIKAGILNGHSEITNITIPFLGYVDPDTTDSVEYPFGYLFGTTSYTGSTSVSQHYTTNGEDYQTVSYYIPSGLNEITVSDTTTIPEEAFINLSMVESINISSSVTTIGSGAFSGCGITNLVIPSSVTSIGTGAFESCENLTDVVVKANISSISAGVFSNCQNLKNIYLSETITTIENDAFCDCYNIEHVYYNNSSADNLTVVINGDGYNQGSFESHIYLSTTMGADEYHQGNWWYLDANDDFQIVENDKTDYVVKYYVDGTVYETQYVYPNTVTAAPTEPTKDKYLLDVWCTDENLTTAADFNSPITANVNFYARFVDGFTYTLSSDGTYYIITDLYKPLKETVVIPESYRGIPVTSVGQSNTPDNYYYNNGVATIIIPDTITEMNGKTVNGMIINYIFYKGTIEDWCNIKFEKAESNPCKGNDVSFYILNASGTKEYYGDNYSFVYDVVIPSTVTKIGDYAFVGINHIHSMVISEGVEELGVGCFMDCDKMTQIVIPSTVTKIDDSAFYGTSTLYDHPYVEIYYNGTVEDYFKIEFGNELSSFAYAVTEYLETIHAFYIKDENGGVEIEELNDIKYSLVTSLEIPSTITTLKSYSLYRCWFTVTIPSTVETIEENALTKACNVIFENDSKITALTENMFANSKATYYVLSDTLTEINKNAFSNNTKLTTIYYYGTEEEKNQITISGDSNSYFDNATWYYFTEYGSSEAAYGNWWYFDNNNKIQTLTISD
ncbi:MAG: leucine-rich repeat protein [Acholeplasmatales bacterium]|nr:leucine-rich repeat protein [Acholeplasmatales bacterium]